MSPLRRRLVPTAIAVLAIGLITAGCTATPGSSAPTSGTGSGGAPVERMPDDVDAVWLDGGRMIAVVTWGSSTPTCRPVLSEVQADGQALTVTLTDLEEAAEGCDSDLTPRAIALGLPEGVDPEQDIELTVVHGDLREQVDLDAIEGAPQGGPLPDPQVSATWLDDDAIALLTWGSSSCPPDLMEVEMTTDGATATFATADRVCTMDFAPRVTIVTLPEARDDDAPFTLTLSGDNLDGTVQVSRD